MRSYLADVEIRAMDLGSEVRSPKLQTLNSWNLKLETWSLELGIWNPSLGFGFLGGEVYKDGGQGDRRQPADLPNLAKSTRLRAFDSFDHLIR